MGRLYQDGMLRVHGRLGELQLTLSNVNPGDSKLFVHGVVAWLISFYFYYVRPPVGSTQACTAFRSPSYTQRLFVSLPA